MTDLEAQIEKYVTHAFKRGGLNSQARLFLAMSTGQTAKGVGCSLAELRYLGNMSKGKAKSGLAQFEKLGILRLGSTVHSVRTLTRTSFYLPRRWAKGKTVERMSGPPVPSYEFCFANKDTVVQVLEGVADRFTANDFIEDLRRRVLEASDREWKHYVSFAKILLAEVAGTIARAQSLYGEFLPRNVEIGVKKSLLLIRELERQCRKEDVVALLGSVKQVLLKPPLP